MSDSVKKKMKQNEAHCLTNQAADGLYLEGIGAKGYGVLPKYPMLDGTLTLEAKAIYAYLCSYTGRGVSVFPGRERILDDLGVNKDTYYKHLHLLLEQGYLSVRQSRSDSGFFKNVYTIVSCPEKFRREAEERHLAAAYTRIRMSGLKGAGYGFVPKAVMCDQTLSLKAKGLYGYYCAFTGAGECAHPRRDTALGHLGISARLLAKYLKELKERNYIEVAQQLNAQGRFGVNEIVLVDAPDPAMAQQGHQFRKSAPCVRFSDTEDADFPCERIWDTRKSDADFSDAENSVTNKNNTPNSNKVLNKNNSSIKEQKDEGAMWWERKEKQYAAMGCQRVRKQVSGKERKLQEKVVGELLRKGELPYEVLQKRETARAAVALMTEDELCGSPAFYRGSPDGEGAYRVFCLYRDCLLDMVSSRRGQRINGCSVTAEEVYRLLLPYVRIAKDDVSFCLPTEEAQESFRAALGDREIRNPVGYMKSCIYNALLSGGLPL